MGRSSGTHSPHAKCVMDEKLPFQIHGHFMVLGEETYRYHSFTVMKKIQTHFWKLDPKKLNPEDLKGLQIQLNEDLKEFSLVCDFQNQPTPVQVSLHVRYLKMDMEAVHPRFHRSWLDFQWSVLGGTFEEAWTELRHRILYPIGTHP